MEWKINLENFVEMPILTSGYIILLDIIYKSLLKMTWWLLAQIPAREAVL